MVRFQVEHLPRNHQVILQDQEQIDSFEHLEHPAHGRGLGWFAGLGVGRNILFGDLLEVEVELPWGEHDPERDPRLALSEDGVERCAGGRAEATQAERGQINN